MALRRSLGALSAALCIFWSLPLLAEGPKDNPQLALVGDATSVIDGSKLTVGRHKVRLWGVYTPEVSSLRGASATVFLSQITLGQIVQCELKGRDETLIVARCWANRRDLSEAVIASGYGRECPSDSGGLYRTAERRFALVGMPLPQDCSD